MYTCVCIRGPCQFFPHTLWAQVLTLRPSVLVAVTFTSQAPILLPFVCRIPGGFFDPIEAAARAALGLSRIPLHHPELQPAWILLQSPAWLLGLRLVDSDWQLGEMQTERTLRFHLTSISMAKINKPARQGWRGTRCWWECNANLPTMETSVENSQTAKNTSNSWPSCSTPWLCLKDSTPDSAGICPAMSAAALLTTARMWIQPNVLQPTN